MKVLQTTNLEYENIRYSFDLLMNGEVIYTCYDGGDIQTGFTNWQFVADTFKMASELVGYKNMKASIVIEGVEYQMKLPKDN